MKFTFDWLRDHLQTDKTQNQLGEKLTELGIEVEDITDTRQKYADFVVGKIMDARRHPNAEKLQLCNVDIGSKTLQIVCGAKNARPGIYVAVALVGAIIPATNERLKKGLIRGEESCGMMCSAMELLLDDDRCGDGIVELQGGTLVPGQDLASALGIDDVIFDVSITPNRADCFCVRGIARDLAAAGAGHLLPLPERYLRIDVQNPVEVEIQTNDCRYFSTIALMGISGKTPTHIAKRLFATGQKLIHMPVDIANYICLDVGQPLHIFDLDKLQDKLFVRSSRIGEKIRTLDGKEPTLLANSVVISDSAEPLSIAGVIGGMSTACSETTKNILIEGAYFERESIARTGQYLRVQSDARVRIEKGVDPGIVNYAVRSAASLIASDSPCKLSELKECGALPQNTKTIVFTAEKFGAIANLATDDFIESMPILKRLGLTVCSYNEKSMTLESPSWRYDLEIEEDIIEEVLRLRGYENIHDVELEKRDPIITAFTVDKISDSLVYMGYYEVKTFSFVDKKSALLFADEDQLIELRESLTTEYSTMRPSVIVSHLKAIKNSQSKSQRNVRIFEAGKHFTKEGANIIEEPIVAATISEKSSSRHWRKAQEAVSVFDIKEDLSKIVNLIGVSGRLQDTAPSYYHPGKSGTYIGHNSKVLAHFGEIHPSILNSMGVTGPVACFELFMNAVHETFQQGQRQPIALSPYQPTSRDFSFVVEKKVLAADILDAIKKLRLGAIVETRIFDVYESQALGNDKKAIAFEVTLQDTRATLSEAQISEISSKIIESVTNNCGGILRDA
ncbi:MAG: phenylalanine--tRNA ligase subunit beta [Holosporales bacterium]|jgi:phenylalanyl-tRNA synthetase beta chain|nr:phenylalanine--tRNA ligase subunit beta [Holosporales bacterium]